MSKYIDAKQLKAELDKRYAEYRAKMKTDDFTYYEGMADALDHLETFLDSLPEQPVDIPSAGSGAMSTTPPKFKLEVKEQPVEGLEEEIDKWVISLQNEPGSKWKHSDILRTARHFAEWGAEHLT